MRKFPQRSAQSMRPQQSGQPGRGSRVAAATWLPSTGHGRVQHPARAFNEIGIKARLLPAWLNAVRYASSIFEKVCYVKFSLNANGGVLVGIYKIYILEELDISC